MLRSTTRSARVVALSAVMCLVNLGHAAHDFGVKQETDEFTGKTTCSQAVINSASDVSGFMMSVSPSKEPVLLIVRGGGGLGDNVFNMFGVMSGDRVLVRFPSTDEVLTLKPVEIYVEDSYEAAAVDATDLMMKILSSPTDIRVRFESDSDHADFTINHDVVVTLAQGFGHACLP